MANERHRNPKPLDAGRLEQLALHYAGRYATTRAKLRSYLGRKLRERGWAGEGEPPLDRLVERFVELGYVDDRAFAAARAASLSRRGYGERRLRQALGAAGIAEEDSLAAREEARGNAMEAALRFAERRRIGPFASGSADPKARERAFAAMLRAGHPPGLARQVLDLKPEEAEAQKKDAEGSQSAKP